MTLTPFSAIPDNQDHDDPFGVGKWVWVKSSRYDYDTKEYVTDEWLGCVLRHGSNYVYIQEPKHDGGNSYVRVHVDKVWEQLRPEPDAERIIAEKTNHYQQEVYRLVAKVQSITARLGVIPKTAISGPSEGAGSGALVSVTEQADTGKYKKDLVKAKEEDLPAVFEEIKRANASLAKWMAAPILPLQSQIIPMKTLIKSIDDRIYTVELYSGLTETATKVRDGDPAMTDAKLHVMQRRLYMDEECLLDYDAGGMEFKDIGSFDEWLCRSHNLDRILPFQRCVVGFRVRRFTKERTSASVLDAFINIQLEQADKWTYFYVRNGEQVWRITTDFEFDTKLFPDKTEYDPVNGGFMIKKFGDRVDSLIRRDTYEVALAEYAERLAKWEAEHPDPEDSWRKPSPPYHGDRLEPMDYSSVYFDDALELVDADVRRFNRIAVIIQGLFDRSLVLHPHPPVKVWDPHSFERSVELIYDSATLTHGDAMDYAAYVAKLSESLGAGSVVLGQEDFWLRREGRREQERRDNDWRRRSDYDRYRDLTHYWPHGDPGPGKITEIVEWKARARKATFRWVRESRNWRAWPRPDDIPCSIEVPATELFNISAYQPGDYLQFFLDPRTRSQYLKWAPTLLTAENYHAKKAKK